MSLEEITELIDSKIEKDPNCITEEQTDEFLRLARNRLENLNYKVYFTGAKFVYENANRTVQDNELLIAIKDK